jgi:hypothetical protein
MMNVRNFLMLFIVCFLGFTLIFMLLAKVTVWLSRKT